MFGAPSGRAFNAVLFDYKIFAELASGPSNTCAVICLQYTYKIKARPFAPYPGPKAIAKLIFFNRDFLNKKIVIK